MFIKNRTICGLVVILFVLMLVGTPIVLTAMNGNEACYTVVVDAGHGGFDGGVVGSSGIKESDINLDIALRLKKILEGKGVNVVMTRSTATAIAPTKKEDMARRRDIITSSHADLTISIHTNKFSDARRRGVQVFYDDTGKWVKAGTIMQRILNESINKKYSQRTDIVSLGGDYFITKAGDMPSIIVECGFISNMEDERLLSSIAYREEIAKVISQGALAILSLAY